MLKHKTKLSRQQGVGLIEVMIAVLVLGIGLLGVVKLQNRSLEYNQQAYFYSQATALAWDIAEKLEANSDAADKYVINFGATASSSKDCASTDCSTEELAKWDLAQWKTSLQRILPQGDAEILQIDNSNEYSISILLNVDKQGESNFDIITLSVLI